MKYREQLDELRAAGYRIRVRHYRVWIPKTPRPQNDSRLSPHWWRRPGEFIRFKPVLAQHGERPTEFSVPAVLSRSLRLHRSR